MNRLIIISSIIFTFISYPALPKVQWASEVLGYSSEYGTKQFSARQILGKPSVMPGMNVTPCAWMPEFRNDSSKEWIKAGFATPINVSRIAISENNISGGIAQVVLIDTNGTEQNIYNSSPDFKKPAGAILNISIPKNEYMVQAVMLTLLYTDPK